ncbi:hypothetical protein PV-S19_0028 [Pacmanvirus S19]|nr:hypothetical protein PV-S19_0028 [Pacmanvirus S19]
MSLPEIFLTSVDSDTIITNDIPLIIACRDNELEGDFHVNPIIFIECNPDIYINSLTCRKMAKIMTKDEILNAYDGENMINVEIIKKLQVVIYMQEQKEYFEIEHINTADEFYHYIKFADKYMLNIELICSKMENIIWLLMIKERQRDLWRANSILLTNIEQKIFNKHKFGPAAQQPPAAYPVGNVAKPVPKYITMCEVKQKKFINNELFADLIHILLRSGALDFVSKIIVVLGSSIEYCDKIFTLSEIIKQVCNMPVFLPSMYYAMRVLYLEELSMFNRKRSSGRFIIDISTASMLPFVSAEYFNSPYFVTTVDVNYKGNLTLPANYTESRGIYNLEKFNKRLSIFTKDAFKNIKWSSDNYQSALSGSIITACAIKNPFEEKFRSVDNYFNEYYPCREITKRTVKINIQNKQNTLYAEYSDSDESDESDNETEPSDGVEDEKKIDYSDIDLMIACEWEMFDKIVYQHYIDIKNVVKSEIKLEKVITENKHKYIIKGLHRDIDIFHVNDIPSVIVKYHLGCVRAWYDGTTVNCFPSFITAAFTGVNMDLRWVSNKKDVRDVVLKYFQRGFGTLINKDDRKSLINYVNQGDLWPAIKTAAAFGWGYKRYNKRPLFHDNCSKMFNPSISKTGIHKYIDAVPTNLHISSRNTFDGNIDIENNYRDLNGKKIITPDMCETLSPYL